LLAQRVEHANLIIDAVDVSVASQVLVDDCRLPGWWHHPINRNGFLTWIGIAITIEISAQNLQGINEWMKGRVV